MNLSNQMVSRGVEYTTSGDENRAFVGSYHHCQNIGVRNLNICAPRDVVGLPRVEQRNVTLESSPFISSKFTIGFEIEKNRFHRNAVMEYPLLAGFEEDSSCGSSSSRRGYEAVTNILPLVAPSTWRNKIFNMFTQAEKIIDDRYSPSNTRCGGHMTIRVEGMTSDELMKRMRKFSGLFYAMFRYRLKNSYCSRNVIMRTLEERDTIRHPHDVIGSGVGEKYSVVNQKRNGLIEYRLPSRITSVKQLMRRYEIMYQMVNFAVNKPNSTFTSFLKACRPTLRMMYKGNEGVSVEFIERLAVEMQKVIRTNKIHLAVAHFFHRHSNVRYTRQALDVVTSADRGESRDLRDHSRNMMIESVDDLRFE